MNLRDRIILALDRQELPSLSIARVAGLNQWNIIFLATTLWKMEREGLLVRSMKPDTWNERNGLRRACYRLSEQGLKKLDELRQGRQ